MKTHVFEAGKDFNMLKQKVKEIGNIQQAARIIVEDIEKGTWRPEEYSIRDMFEALDSTTFPKAVGALINKKLIDAYNAYPTIWNNFVDVVPSNKKTETIVGFGETDTPDIVAEGMPYGETGFGEKYVTAENIKYGRIIAITEETIKFDQTGQVLQRAKTIGEKSAYKQEQLVIEAVIDKNGTVYKKNGIATSVYSASPHGNLTTTAFSEAGLKAIEVLMDKMTDDNGDYVGINRGALALLVPSDIKMVAWQMLNSTLTPESAENAPNYFKGKYALYSSPFCSGNSTTLYYLGEFKRSFWWLEVYPLQLLERNMKDTDEGFKRDIIAMFKTRFYGAPICIDHRYVFRGGT